MVGDTWCDAPFNLSFQKRGSNAKVVSTYTAQECLERLNAALSSKRNPLTVYKKELTDFRLINEVTGEVLSCALLSNSQ